jgi:hypothetical protein
MSFFSLLWMLAFKADEYENKAAHIVGDWAFPEEARDLYDIQPDENSPHVVALRSHQQLLLQMVLSRMVDNYLVYIADLLALIFRTKPETLRSSEKVRLDTVLAHDNMEELISDLAERQVNRLSYQGMRDLSQYLSGSLKFDLFKSPQDLKRAAGIIELRNLIVHNRAVVNRHFLSRVPDSPTQVGEVVELDLDSVFSDVQFLTGSASDLDARASDKFGLAR